MKHYLKWLITKWLYQLDIYNPCGCDACHFEAYDFKYFYWYKDWDVENPKWVFSFRNPGK